MKTLDYGSLIISLDFEMMWGCHDWATVDGYGTTNVRQVRAVIDKMLDLFEKYEVHATFAIVGLVFCNNKKEALLSMPHQTPSYTNKKRSPYRDGYIESIEPKDEELYFAPDVIEQLEGCPNIEIATHTFSHYFCWEPGQTIFQFEADLEMAIRIAERNKIAVKSIVFPRNEVSAEYLVLCAKHGIMAYRGNAKKYFNKTSNRVKALYYKMARLLDAYIDWGGNTSIPYNSLDKNSVPINVPASRMLRPYMKRLRLFEGLRLRRIRKEMIQAAKHKELYHLWWHPHNFGADIEMNLSFLEQVLMVFKECKEKYGMQSYTIMEFANEIQS